MVNIWLIIIWLVVEPPTPLKTDGVKVSLDDDIPNWMDKNVPKPPASPVLLFKTHIYLQNRMICG